MIDLLKQKKADLENFLAEGKTTIILNGTQFNVVLPKHLKEKDTVRLNLSLGLKHDIYISDTEVKTILNFNQKDFSVVIPLSSIYCIHLANNPFRIESYPESYPKEESEYPEAEETEVLLELMRTLPINKK